MYYNDGTDYTRGARAIAAAGDDGRTPWIRRQVSRNVVVESQPQVSRRRYASMVTPMGDEALSPSVLMPTSPGVMYPPPPRLVAPIHDVLMPTNPAVLHPPAPDGRPAFVGPTAALPGGGIQHGTVVLPAPPKPASSGMGGVAVLGAIVAAAVLAFS